jgi:hypothetical protein
MDMLFVAVITHVLVVFLVADRVCLGKKGGWCIHMYTSIRERMFYTQTLRKYSIFRFPSAYLAGQSIDLRIFDPS